MKQWIKTGTLIALIVIGLVLALLLANRLLPLLLLVLIAVVLTTGIDPVVGWLQRLKFRRYRMPRVLAILLVLLFGVLVILGIVAFLVFTAVSEAIYFAQNTWPALQGRLLNWAQGLADRYAFIPEMDVLYDRLRAQTGRIAGYLWSTTQAVFGVIGGILSTVTVLILTVFFSNYKDGITRTFALLIPPRYQDRALEVSHLAGRKMGGWLRGQLLLAIIVTVLIMGAMWLLGVPYAALIGIIGGIGELVPMVGPYVAAIPAIIIVLTIGAPLWQIIAVIAFFLILSQVENYVLTPKIMQREVELPAVTTIIALLIGGSLLGLVGALLAVPIAAAGRIVFLEAIFPAIQGKPREEVEKESEGEEKE
ncbi:MAG: AI-2E family transporter [Armatimonadota bacterium]